VDTCLKIELNRFAFEQAAYIELKLAKRVLGRERALGVYGVTEKFDGEPRIFCPLILNTGGST
jgi:hypothetical protein